jgi:hypothetical protein
MRAPSPAPARVRKPHGSQRTSPSILGVKISQSDAILHSDLAGGGKLDEGISFHRRDLRERSG